MTWSILLGPPGTGKTTTLLGMVDDLLKAGTLPSRIGFISFTRKAAEEAVTRACDKFKREPGDFPYFRTIHSFCFRQLGISTALLMKRDQYQELGEKLGIEFALRGGEAEEIEELAKGDRLLFIEGLARLRCVPLRQQWEESDLQDVTWDEVDQLARGLFEYKKAQGLLDFTDVLDRFLSGAICPDLDVLFVDEAQDLSQLQWRVVNKIAKGAGRVVVAGDDDQAIFRWSGADVDHFLNLPGEARVLDKSYRLGPAVHALASGIVNGIGRRRAKAFAATEKDSEVSHAASLYDLPIDQGQWLLLTRHGYQLKDLERHCLRSGYDFQVKERGPRAWPSLKAARAWEGLRRGEAWSQEQVRDCLRWLRGPAVPVKNIGRGEWTLARLRDLFGDQGRETLRDRIWHEALRIPEFEREYLIAARRQGENFRGPPRIRISTIHGAKGGEADNVGLFTDISERTFRSLLENEDDERRVFYVGATRARKHLYIVSPQTPRAFPL